MQRSTEPFEWCGLQWSPHYSNRGYIVYYKSAIKNLWLQLKDDKLIIKNSLHKFYMDNNYAEFAFAKAQHAIEILDNHFPFSIYDAIVKYVACGIVIQEEAQPIFESWADYKGKFPQVMRNGTKIYGVHYKATNYNIKGYDKTYEVKNNDRKKLNAPYFRFEVEAKAKYYYARKKDAIPIYTVRDLVNKDNYTNLLMNLLEIYTTLKKKPIIPYAALQPKEIKLMAAMNDKEAINGLKKYHKHSYVLDRKKYAQLLKQIEENPFNQQVIEKLKTKIQAHL